MSQKRRERLRRLLDSLVQLPQFSVEEAKRSCAAAAPRTVTVAIGDLVREGVLRSFREGQEERYRWVVPVETFPVDAWIDRQIHADQVLEMPVHERPRERLLREGPAALGEAELLAILIRVGVRGESAVAGARRIANRFAGKLEQLRGNSPHDLRMISKAATPSSYAQIMAGIELGRRIAHAEARRRQTAEQITGTDKAREFCLQEFAYLAHDGVQEEFHIVTLDTKNKPIHTHRITVGTLDASLVHPREVFRPAIRDAAAAVLLLHNHPSGDPTPSREDHAVTDRLTEAGHLIGIQVLDHVVVARDQAISLREHR